MNIVGFIGLWAGLAAMTLVVLMLPAWHPPKWLCDGTGLPLFPKDAWKGASAGSASSGDGGSESD